MSRNSFSVGSKAVNCERKDAAVEKVAAQFGASSFFIKPFDDEEFLQAVRSALSVDA